MMIRLVHTLKQTGLALTGGYVLMFYSEFLFYGQLSEPGTPQPGEQYRHSDW